MAPGVAWPSNNKSNYFVLIVPRCLYAAIDTSTNSGKVPLEVTFDASNSWDVDGSIVGYEWDFDSDGSVDSTVVTVDYTYLAKGIKTAQLTVIDNDGLRETSTVRIVAWGDPDLDGDLDVDQEDFGSLQACLSDVTAACDDADLNADTAVNQFDMDFLRSCMNGPNNPPSN